MRCFDLGWKLSNLGTSLGIIFLCLSLTFSQNSFALPLPSGLKNPTASVNCDDFCEQFVVDKNADNPKHLAAGLQSSSPWSNVDDALCSELSPTTTSYNASPTPSADAASCVNVQVSDKIYENLKSRYGTKSSNNSSVSSKDKGLERICEEAGKLKDHCIYHNTQVETQCMAYKALTSHTGGGITQDGILLGMDFGVAATCGIACATENPVAIGLCAASATAEGIAEMASTISLMKSPTGQALNTFIKASEGMNIGTTLGGIAGAAGGLAVGGHSLLSRESAGDSGKDPDEAKAKKANQAKRQKMLACGTAAVFATLGGIRTAALVQLTSVAKNACSAINQLFSNNGSGTNNSDYSSGSHGGTSGGTLGNSSGTQGGTSGATGGNLAGISDDQVNQLNNCQGDAQCLSQAGIGQSRTTASTDANLITPNANIGPLLSPIGSLGNFVKKATSEGAGAALGNILPSSLGSLGSALATIANTAQNDGSAIAGPLHMDSVYAGGGAASKGQGSGNPDSFAGLFGAGGGSGGGIPGGISNTASFGEDVKIDDIWHTGSKLTLFQIVSEKTGKTSNRVETIAPRVFDLRE